jgi:O-antigen/teichoic acid export membrane protein
MKSISLLYRFNLTQGMFATLAEVLYYGIIFLTSVVVARVYGATSFGQYSVNFFLVSILVNIGNGGFTAILRKKLSCIEAIEYSGYIQSYFFLRIAFGLLLFFIGTCYLSLTQDDSLVMIVLFAPLFFSRFIDGLTEIIHSVFVVNGRFQIYFQIKLVYCICCLMIIGIALVNKIDIKWFYWILTIPSLVMLLISAYQLDFLSTDRINIKTSIVIESIKESWPLLINAGIFAIYSRYWIFYSDTIFAKHEVATVSAAMTIVSSIALVPNAIGVMCFPKLCRLANQASSDELRIFVRKMVIFMTITGLVITLGVYFFAPLMPYIFGEVGYESILYLKILSASLIPTFIMSIIGYLTTAINRQKVGLIIATLILIACIPIYAILASLMGLIGIAFGYVAIQYISIALASIYLFNWFKRRN